MRGRRRWAAALVAAVAMVATGCGGGGGIGNLRGQGQGVNDVNPVDPARMQDGGTFRWPLQTMPAQFNNNQVDGTPADNAEVDAALLPAMFTSDAAGNLRPDPDYLTSAELVSADPEVIDYKINPKAVWSDGTPITWQDFDAQVKALNGTNPAYQVAGTTGYEDIATVTPGADDREVRVTFKKKYADWRNLFSLLYPRSTNSDPTVFNTGWTDHPLTSAGPFKFQSIDHTAKTITLVRNEKWWGARPRLDRIIFRAIPPDAQPEAFANNEVDFLDIGPSVSNLLKARQVPGAVIRKALGPNYRAITVNGAPGAILADPRLRLAIMKGIDRQVITQSQIGPIIPDATPLGNHIYVQGQRGYEDHSQVVAYDPDAARRELDGLGWVQQGAARAKDGKQLVIRDVIPSQIQVSAQEASLVQQQLAAIGVKLDIQTVPVDTFFSQYIDRGDFDITHFSWLETPTPISSGSGIWKLVPGSVDQNYGHIGDEKINTLLDAANAELDPAKQIQLANQADQEIWNIGHSLVLYQRPDAVAERANVANFGATGFASLDYTRIGFTR